MSFFRRTPRVAPLDPVLYRSAREWLFALLDAGLPTDEIRSRLDEQLRREERLHEAAEREARRRDFADRTRDARWAATDRLLHEVGLDLEDEFVVPPLHRPSDQIARGEFPWAY
jgi:hypothetical protein